MILADTSIWAGHFREPHPRLTELLQTGEVLSHPFVIGELALGGLPRRQETLRDLRDLPQTEVAGPTEVLFFIDTAKLAGSGIGYVDAHLLVAVRLTPDARLWTMDGRLAAAAERLGLAAPA